MKRLRTGSVVPWLAAAVLVAGCGGGARKPPTISAGGSQWEVTTESPLDSVRAANPPLPAYGDTVASGPAVNVAAAAQPADTLGAPPDSGLALADVPVPDVPVPDPKDFTPGWRVQIFASPNMTTAETSAREARKRFTEPVYLEYEPPYYKVRVGDFLTRAEADAMATRARAVAPDYAKAWVVETLVLKPGGATR